MSDDLSDALDDAHRRYVEAHPRSAAMHDRAAAVLPGGNTRSVLHIDPFAFRVARADGGRLHDVDGHTYVDLLGDYSAGLLGRGEAIASVVRDVLERGWSYGATSESEALFAETIVSRFPSMDQVRFTNSGTEANLMALLTARHVTGRPRIVVFDGGYHGGPLYFGPTGAPLQIPFEFAVLPFNDVDAVRAEFSADGDRIGAVLVEPMLGASGCIPGQPAFLQSLRDMTRTAGSVLIFDEVMTSRLAVGGAQQLLGIVPDMTTIGKYFGGGFSIGAFGGQRRLMSAFDPAAGGLAHSGTFNNNAFTMTVGAAATALLSEETLDTVNRRGERLRDALNDEFRARSSPFQATGWGSLLNIHPHPGTITRPSDLDGADSRWRELLFFDLLDAGFYLAPRGYMAISIEISDEDVDVFTVAVGNILERRRPLFE